MCVGVKNFTCFPTHTPGTYTVIIACVIIIGSIPHGSSIVAIVLCMGPSMYNDTVSMRPDYIMHIMHCNRIILLS